MTPSLQSAFEQLCAALKAGELDAFYAALDDDIVIFDEDSPWRLSKMDFAEHVGFHVTVWESFAWLPREVKFQTVGNTGIVSGYATFRGKPKDAGFRQRFMGFTQTWINDGMRWRMVCWHQSPLQGQIDGASPS